MLNVKDFGAVGNGIADDTGPIQDAIDSLVQGSGQIYIPSGVYRITSTLAVTKDFTNLRGDGVNASILKFAPNQDGLTCLRFAKPDSSVLIGCSVVDLTVSSDNGTFQKTGIETVALLMSHFDRVAVRGTYIVPGVGRLWTNNGAAVNPNTSIGWHLRGYEALSFTNCTAFADSPVRISVNPNDPNIAIDHVNWHNWYSIANGNYNIEIESGVHLFDVVFDGFQSWVGGLGGLRWVDTTTTAASQMLRLENVRTEQGKDPEGWILYIDHHYGLYGLQINNMFGGIGEAPDSSLLPHNGIYTRKVINAEIQSFNFLSTATKIMYDTVGAPGYRIDFRDITCPATAIVNLPNMRLQEGSWTPASAAPIPANAVYTYDNPVNAAAGWPRLGPTGREGTVKGTALPRNGGSVNLRFGTGANLNFMSFRVVTRGATRSEGGSRFLTTGGMFREGGTPDFEVTDVPGKLCLIKSGSTVLIKNNLAEDVDWFVFAIGAP